MKRYVVLLIVAVSCLCSLAGEEFRIFMDEQGRAIMLRVVECDLKNDKVTVEREDGRRLSVKISAFSKSDQDYVAEWFRVYEAASEQNLRISVVKRVVGSREVEISGHVTTSGGGSWDEKAGEMEYENIAYDIVFENKAGIDVADLSLEYNIYYEQAKRGMKDPRQEVLVKDYSVPILRPNAKQTFRTESVEILNERFVSSGYTRHPAEGEVHGIRCRLSLNLDDERVVVREFSYPRGLSEKKYPWKN